MSIPITAIVEPDGTLRYNCGKDIAVLVSLHRRNGTKKCPIELLYQGSSILVTESNLLELRDVEQLTKHATTRHKGVDWHEILTAVTKELPEKAHAPWTPVAKSLDTYAVERKEYLWYPVLPKGEPGSLQGDPAVGKSALLTKFIAHLTTGTRFPTLFPDHPEQDFPPRNVVLFTYEDDPSSTIKPRVLINGGVPSRVQIIEGKRDPETKVVVPMTLQDLPQIEDLLKAFQPALMAFDPLQSFFGTDVDMNHANDTRPILDAVRNLCNAYDCTPLYIRHNGKTQRAKAMHAALGSIDISANMRSVLALYKDPDDTQRRILAHTKSNGRTAPSMQFRLVGATLDVPVEDNAFVTVEDVRVDWDGLSDLTDADLNARETIHGNDTQEAESALDQAREFLREVLADGPLRVDDLLEAAKHAGMKRRTLDRAKDKEGIKARRITIPDAPSNKWPWEWYTPTGRGGSS